MAKNRAFFSAARGPSRWHTPVVAIVSQGVCAILMTATPFSRPGVLHRHEPDDIHRALGGPLFVFRRTRPGWQKLRAVDFAFPLIPASYILVGTAW